MFKWVPEVLQKVVGVLEELKNGPWGWDKGLLQQVFSGVLEKVIEVLE